MEELSVVKVRQKISAETWKERITACRSSGMSVVGWCRENHICPQTYYRWERQIVSQISPGKQMPVIQEQTCFAEIASVPVKSNEVIAVLRAGGISCELHAGIQA